MAFSDADLAFMLASAIGPLWKAHRRRMAPGIRSAFIELLLALRIHVLPDNTLDTSAVGRARYDVRGLSELFHFLASSRGGSAFANNELQTNRTFSASPITTTSSVRPPLPAEKPLLQAEFKPLGLLELQATAYNNQQLVCAQNETISRISWELDTWRALGPAGAISCTALETHLHIRSLTAQLSAKEKDLEQAQAAITARDASFLSFQEWARAQLNDFDQQRQTLRLEPLVPTPQHALLQSIGEQYSGLDTKIGALQTIVDRSLTYLSEIKQSLSNGKIGGQQQTAIKSQDGFPGQAPTNPTTQTSEDALLHNKSSTAPTTPPVAPACTDISDSSLQPSEQRAGSVATCETTVQTSTSDASKKVFSYNEFVTLRGLKATQYNGKHGIVLFWDSKSERYSVSVEGRGETIKVKSDNLEVFQPGVDPSPQSPSSTEFALNSSESTAYERSQFKCTSVPPSLRQEPDNNPPCGTSSSQSTSACYVFDEDFTSTEIKEALCGKGPLPILFERYCKKFGPFPVSEGQWSNVARFLSCKGIGRNDIESVSISTGKGKARRKGNSVRERDRER